MFVPYARFLLLLGIVSVAHVATASHLGLDPGQEHSSPCIEPSVSGVIQIRDASNHSMAPLGLVSRKPNMYGGVTISGRTGEGMTVKLNHNCNTSEPFHITPVNPLIVARKCLGAANLEPVCLAADFGEPGRENHAWFTQTELSASHRIDMYRSSSFAVPRGPSQRTIIPSLNPAGYIACAECVIWTLQNNPAGDEPFLLVPSWVNTDGSVAPNVSLLYLRPSEELIMTDDVEHYLKRYRGRVQVVEFVFLPQD
ncbi:hypothetical protein C8Q73DRAFT_669774 [Cubamyces lactineus]|nr:hypothetical protein C8Q73DRAFT_669774 [Cubamyces lactineus]